MTELVRQLGSGKNATVFEARTDVGRRVAIKQLSQPVQQNSPKRERLFAAAEAWASMEHRGLVNYHDLDQERCWIVMELMQESAAQRVAQGGVIDADTALTVLRDALNALHHLHTQGGYLHANLKLTNLFFDSEGRVRISDGLGVAVETPGTLPAPTTKKYIAPEQAYDVPGRIGPRLDLYTLGFVVLELLAGKSFGKRFTGVGEQSHEDDLSWFQWHASTEVAPPAREVNPACPSELAVVIDRLLLKNPNDRYQSAHQALADLPQTVKVSPVASTAPTVTAQATHHEAMAGDVIQRPTAGMVLLIASGSRAGEIVGSDADEAAIGYDHDCAVRFSAEQYPHSNAKIVLRRGAEGWRAVKAAGEMIFVNRTELSDSITVRSGDILRLSHRGPDVQFVLQSGGPTINDLAERHLPSRKRPKPRRPTQPANVDRASSEQSQKPDVQTTPAAAPARPSLAAAGNEPKRPSDAGSASNVPPVRPAAAPVPPSRPGVGPPSPVAAAPAPPIRPESGLPSNAPAAPVAGDTSPRQTLGGAAESWTDPKTWSKNRKNLVVGVVSSMVALVVIYLMPSGSRESAPPASEPSVATTDDTLTTVDEQTDPSSDSDNEPRDDSP